MTEVISTTTTLAPAAHAPDVVVSVSTDLTKPFWASQTVWGGVAAFGAGVTGAVLAFKANDMAGAMTAITAAFAGIMAIIGRFRAVAVIK